MFILFLIFILSNLSSYAKEFNKKELSRIDNILLNKNYSFSRQFNFQNNQNSKFEIKNIFSDKSYFHYKNKMKKKENSLILGIFSLKFKF